MVTSPWKKKVFVSWKESCDNPRQHIKNQRYHFIDKVPCKQSYGFSSSHAVMWELNHVKEAWVLNSWCFWIVVLKKTLESPLDSWEIKPVNPKGSQPWIFIWRTDAEALILGHLTGRANLLEKILMLRKFENWKGEWGDKWYRMRGAEVTNSMDMSLRKIWKIVKDKEPGVL